MVSMVRGVASTGTSAHRFFPVFRRLIPAALATTEVGTDIPSVDELSEVVSSLFSRTRFDFMTV